MGLHLVDTARNLTCFTSPLAQPFKADLNLSEVDTDERRFCFPFILYFAHIKKTFMSHLLRMHDCNPRSAKGNRTDNMSFQKSRGLYTSPDLKTEKTAVYLL